MWYVWFPVFDFTGNQTTDHVVVLSELVFNLTRSNHVGYSYPPLCYIFMLTLLKHHLSWFLGWEFVTPLVLSDFRLLTGHSPAQT
jgi:hypothetical protein